MKRSETVFSLILIPLDFIACFGAFLFSYVLRQKINLDPQTLGNLAEVLQIEKFESLPPLDFYWRLSFFASLLILVIFALIGLYRTAAAFYNFKEVSKNIIGVSAGIALIILLGFFLRTYLLPRLIIILVWFLAIVFLVSIRLLARVVQRALYRYDIGVAKIAVYGSNGLAERVGEEISRSRLKGFNLYKKYESREKNQLIAAIKRNLFDQVLIADHSLPDETLNLIREHCIAKHIRFSYIPNLFEVSTPRVEIRQLSDLPIIEVKPTSLDGYGRVVKRISDVILSASAIIILSPLMLLLTVLIKIFLPGPVIFRHKRLGLAGKEIEILKFRSMKYEWCDTVTVQGKSGIKRFEEFLAQNSAAAGEWAAKQKLKRDPRISPFGRFLRKSNLDELLQFFNILKGDISLVGPRPIIEKEKERYGDLSSRLFAIRPGLTGLWQVSGRNDLTYEERVRLDILYVENWSFWWDIAILFKTITVLLTRKGAY